MSELLRTSEPATADEEAVATALAAFIARGNAEDASFDALARRLFGYQYARNEPYRRFCQSQGVTPETVGHWSAIPPAPAAAFKRFPLSCTPPANAARLFRSSGTTGRAASRHYLSVAALRLYDQSLREGSGASCSWMAPVADLGLMPTPEAAPKVTSCWARSWRRTRPRPPLLERRRPRRAGPAGRPRALTELVILFGTARRGAFLDAGGGTSCRPARPVGDRRLWGRSRAVSREERTPFSASAPAGNPLPGRARYVRALLAVL